MACAALASARRIVQQEQALTEAQTEVSSAAAEQAESDSNTSGEISRKYEDHRFCIGEDTDLVCGDDSFIVVKSAYYNRAKKDLATGKKCAPVVSSTDTQDDASCIPKSTKMVGEKCDGHQTCTLKVQDHKSCVTRPWTFMRVRYSCEAAKDKPKDETKTGKQVVSPEPTKKPMDDDMKSVVADSLREAIAHLERLKAAEEKIKQDALNQKAAKERAKSHKESQKQNDCTFKCNGWACLGKPFTLLHAHLIGHCHNLDRQLEVFKNEINNLKQKIENAQKEIDRLKALIASKHTAAETAAGLEKSIAAKEAELLMEHKLLKDEKKLNALEAEDMMGTHKAQLANLDGHIAGIDANITALQAIYDLLMEKHSVLSCEDKVAKQERVCLECASPQKPCGDQCISATERCHKLPGCACQAKPASFIELSGAKEGTHPLRQQLQETRQQIGEAVHAHEKTIFNLAADLTLTEVSLQEAQTEKERVKAEFDAALQKLKDSRGELETRKADAEANMLAAQGELAKAIDESDSAIGALAETLLAEIARLTNEKLSLKTSRDAMEQTHLQEMKAMQDAHEAEINGLSARITSFEVQLKELHNTLDKLKKEHNV